MVASSNANIARFLTQNVHADMLRYAHDTYPERIERLHTLWSAIKDRPDAITKAQRIDLLPYKIKVTAIHPGAALTDFSLVRFKGDESKANPVYEGYQPLLAEDIADTAWFVANTPAHVCINDIVMTCVAQANSTAVWSEWQNMSRLTHRPGR
jgi:hypothetical protein